MSIFLRSSTIYISLVVLIFGAVLIIGVVEIVAALAFIGEKSCGISWDFQHFQIPGEFFSFSPHLMGFVQILPPPREVLSISWDLQTKMINKPNFYTLFCRNQVSPGILVITRWGDVLMEGVEV